MDWKYYLKDIGEVPEDLTEDLTDNEHEEVQENEENENISDNDNSGKGVLDYDINDLLNEFVWMYECIIN